MNLQNKKILVTYFSHKGQNYSNGKIVDLQVGNTAAAADIIAKYTKADLFEIVTVKEYPYEYTPCTDEAKEELKANFRPELAGNIDITDYDAVFPGYPNWWGTMPMAVCTFIENHDFTGKIIFPFCTHEGSGMGSSETDLRKLLKDADIRKGLAIRGSSVTKSEQKIQDWIERG